MMMAAVVTVLNYIGGQYVGAAEGGTLESVNPATGRVHLTLPDSGTADVDLAVVAATAAFPAWSRRPREERAQLLERVADHLERRLDEFAAAEARDQGKPLRIAREIEIPRAVHNFRFFASTVRHEHNRSTQLERAGCVNYTTRQPVGVAGLISPWNLPLYLLTWKIAPALAFGCTCVCKPSELTSLTAFLLCSVLDAAGVPAGVVNMVFGTGPRAGQALVAHPRVPLISFTGGTATGERVIAASAPHYKKLSLELGGKNAGIIFDDADLAACVPTVVRSAFQNQGEICLCTSRLFVQAGVYDRFVAAYVAAVRALRVGDPFDPATDVGALISDDHRRKVLSYIELARKTGGTVLCGGEAVALPGDLAGGFYVAPTVIVGLAADSRVCQEEIFGPVVTVTPFVTEDDAVRWTNDCKYGLAASVWTENASRLHRVAQALEVRPANAPRSQARGRALTCASCRRWGRSGATAGWCATSTCPLAA
jgi:aminomuconate-semialdehyde dehydrogenase